MYIVESVTNYIRHRLGIIALIWRRYQFTDPERMDSLMHTTFAQGYYTVESKGTRTQLVVAQKQLNTNEPTAP